MQRDRLDDLIADRVDRIERGHRLLKDHRDLFAAQPSHLVLGERKQIAPLERESPRRAPDPAAGNQPQDRQRRHRFAAPALADQGHRLARKNGDARLGCTGRTRPRLVSKPIERLEISRSGCVGAGIDLILPTASVALSQLGIQGVSNRFTDEVIRENSKENRQPGKGGHPPDKPRTAGAGLVEHRAPTGLIDQAQSQKTQNAFIENRRRDAEARAHQEWREPVWQHVTE